MIYRGNCVNSTGKNSGSEEITALLKEIGGRDVRKIIHSIYFCTLFGEFFFLPFFNNGIRDLYNFHNYIITFKMISIKIFRS